MLSPQADPPTYTEADKEKKMLFFMTCMTTKVVSVQKVCKHCVSGQGLW